MNQPITKTAILVDGGFYRRRIQALEGDKPAKERADDLFAYCLKHLQSNDEVRSLYRIFYYDCPPMDRKIFHPFLQKQIDFSKTSLFAWTNEFFEHLRSKRKTALRLGELSYNSTGYLLTPNAVKKLLSKSITVDDLREEDFTLDIEQKGVDMRIGVDIASMTFKKQVQQIILISGDSDFIPAAKLARREGIDFILDPMWSDIKTGLSEHIDGIQSRAPRSHKAGSTLESK